MRCIFCKETSDDSIKIEHIIPESLGNKSHILSPGIVCDKCNQYFGSKVEKEVLEQAFFRNMRFRQFVVNKKGKPPIGKAILVEPFPHPVEIREVDNHLEVIIHDEEAFKKVFEQMEKSGNGKLVFSSQDTPPFKNDIYISRFLAKIAVELLISKVCKVDGWEEEFIDHTDLDRIRNYSRYGAGKYWPYKYRQIHDENKWDREGEEEYQMVHEMDIISFKKHEFYLIVSFFGHEFSINMTDRNLDSYHEWLSKNNNISPLSFDKFPQQYEY